MSLRNNYAHILPPVMPYASSYEKAAAGCISRMAHDKYISSI